jgi:hypothetical protein
MVTVEEVKVILGNEDVPDPLINAMITGADALLSKVFAGDVTLGTDLLYEIEKWLVAHMVASTPNYRTTTEEQLGDADFKYTGKFGSFLESTPFGQMVLTLDFTGKLKNMVGKAQASIVAVPSEYRTEDGYR